MLFECDKSVSCNNDDNEEMDSGDRRMNAFDMDRYKTMSYQIYKNSIYQIRINEKILYEA
jgi:hypothetical protein